MNTKRGDIFFIRRRSDYIVGSEIKGSRPGIIVSNNALNTTSDVVEVVYLTTQPKKELPTHATIQATGVPSVALCEQVDHVSLQLLGDYCGTCSEEEMADVDRALLASLGLTHTAAVDGSDKDQLRQLRKERDRYALVVDHLLGIAE